MKDINLRHIKLNSRHGTYSYKAISSEKSVKEFIDSIQKLEDKLAPYFEEKERIEKEEEQKRKIEEERIREQKKAEAIQKAKEEKEKREKWLASPEYAALKKKRIKIFSTVFIVLAIAGGGFFIKNSLMQDKSNSDSVSINF